MKGRFDRTREGKAKKENLFDFVQYLPLLAAIFAPVSTLLDIPGLTEPWFLRYDEPQADIKTSVILSALSLAFDLSS